MANTKIPSELSSTPSISDSGDATAITIDSSENVTLSNDLTVDTNTLHVDSTNNRVGVGTLSPAAELHVSGDSIANTFKLIANSSVSGSDATIFRPADNTMAFSTNGTERMRISNAGLITTPNRPAFMLGTPTTATAGNVWKSSTIWYNNGNHWNNTTGRFTAPVAGYYMFYHWGMLAHGQTTTDADNYTRKNGTRDQIGTAYCGAQGGHYLQFTATVVRYLAANDYVDLYIHAGTIYNGYGDRHGSFGGFLLG